MTLDALLDDARHADPARRPRCCHALQTGGQPLGRSGRGQESQPALLYDAARRALRPGRRYPHIGIIRILRQATLDAAFLAHPNRFKHSKPHLPPMPTAAWINPPREEKVPTINTVNRTPNEFPRVSQSHSHVPGAASQPAIFLQAGVTIHQACRRTPAHNSPAAVHALARTHQPGETAP